MVAGKVRGVALRIAERPSPHARSAPEGRVPGRLRRLGAPRTRDCLDLPGHPGHRSPQFRAGQARPVPTWCAQSRRRTTLARTRPQDSLKADAPGKSTHSVGRPSRGQRPSWTRPSPSRYHADACWNSSCCATSSRRRRLCSSASIAVPLAALEAAQTPRRHERVFPAISRRFPDIKAQTSSKAIAGESCTRSRRICVCVQRVPIGA